MRSGGGEATAALNSFSAEAKIPVRGPIDRVTASYRDIEASSNPVRVAAEPPPFSLYWGDPHGMLFSQRPYTEHFAWGKDVNDSRLCRRPVVFLQYFHRGDVGKAPRGVAAI